MNYRHAYHAGNFADVVKHAVLVALLESLKQKDTPFSYFETHAGAGRYDLRSTQASKTREHLDGIVRLLHVRSLPPPLRTYIDLLHGLSAQAKNAQWVEYPGSPLIASLLARRDDRLVLCELQPDEAARLKLEFRRDPRVAVHQRDGYEALVALLPPTPRRGLALIDPPFEAQLGEFDAITAALAPAFERWPTGIYAVWYPIKLRQHVTPFHRWLKRCGMRNILATELLVHPDNSTLRLNGCGLAIVNAPWRFDHVLHEIMPVLATHLAQDRSCQQTVEWLVEE